MISQYLDCIEQQLVDSFSTHIDLFLNFPTFCRLPPLVSRFRESSIACVIGRGGGLANPEGPVRNSPRRSLRLQTAPSISSTCVDFERQQEIRATSKFDRPSRNSPVRSSALEGGDLDYEAHSSSSKKHQAHHSVNGRRRQGGGKRYYIRFVVIESHQINPTSQLALKMSFLSMLHLYYPARVFIYMSILV